MVKKDNGYMGMLFSIVAFMVSLAVGSAMIGGTLVVPFLYPILSVISGWIVVGTTIVGGVMALMKKFG